MGAYSRFLYGSNWYHDLGLGLCTASIEIAAQDRYISFHDMQLSNPHYDITEKRKYPMKLTNSNVIPDNVFGIMTDGKRKWYGIEFHTGSEDSFTFYRDKVVCYDKAFATEEYKRLWGISNFKVLIVVPSDNVKALLQRQAKKSAYPERYLFKSIPKAFDTYRIADPFTEIFTEPWEDALGDDFSICG